MSTRVEGMPRQVYRYYLGLLALLGDFTNSPVDLFALPSARQLALPERTGVGLQLLAGPLVAMWVAQLLLMAVLMPLLAGAVYTAWIRLFGDQAPAAASVSGQLEA